MSRYQKCKETIQATKQPIYSPYVMLGYPTAEQSFEVCRALIAAGVPSLELGLPFRDPAADGPVIQAAGIAALERGFTTEMAIDLVARLRALDSKVALTLMCYYNMVLARGADEFIGSFAAAGLDALLVPDLPPERADEILPFARKHAVDVIFIASPLSDEKRLKMIRDCVGGFVYVVTRLGITGVHEGYDKDLSSLFDAIHAQIPLPALAGFGISTPEQAVKMIEAGAEGVITGSRLVQLVTECFGAGRGDLTPILDHTRAMLDALAKIKIRAA